MSWSTDIPAELWELIWAPFWNCQLWPLRLVARSWYEHVWANLHRRLRGRLIKVSSAEGAYFLTQHGWTLISLCTPPLEVYPPVSRLIIRGTRQEIIKRTEFPAPHVEFHRVRLLSLRGPYRSLTFSRCRRLPKIIGCGGDLAIYGEAHPSKPTPLWIEGFRCVHLGLDPKAEICCRNCVELVLYGCGNEGLNYENVSIVNYYYSQKIMNHLL